MVHLDLYTLRLPIGTVSDSKTFWKSVDEQAVGVAMEDRLYKSGIRTGLAPKSQGAFFSQFFDKQGDAENSYDDQHDACGNAVD